MIEHTSDVEAAAAELLAAHDRAGQREASEADIVHRIAHLLKVAELIKPDEARLEENRVDLVTDRVMFEVKRRISTRRGGGVPDEANMEQLDGYLRAASARGEPDKLGVLTDGKYWVVRFPSELGQPPTMAEPQVFTLHDAVAVGDWIDWLGDRSQILPRSRGVPDAAELASTFGSSLRGQDTLRRLEVLYEAYSASPTVQVKRVLWQDLLGAALGEVVEDETDLDGLFIRHTYLTTVVALAVQQAFGVDLEAVANDSPQSLVDGSEFDRRVGISGVVDSDFFGWPAEVADGPVWVAALARWVATFEWSAADYDVGRALYEGVVTAEERNRLGEYYTPDWLATQIVSEVVDDPLNQRVLDPSCGSGTFLRAVVAAHIAAGNEQGLSADEILASLRAGVIGIDIHPVAVYLAKAMWVLAARRVIIAADERDGSVPVYLGDSLQLRAHTNATGGLFGSGDSVIVEASTMAEPVQLEFPKRLVSDGDRFDTLMMRATTNIKEGLEPVSGISQADMPEGDDYKILQRSLNAMRTLHEEGRNHIWGYYVRNLVRPIWLSNDEQSKPDRIVGNPPWLSYRKTRSSLRIALDELAKKYYKIWPKQQYVTNADISSLFFTRCMDLYLAEGGRQAMVMPYATLGAGQYAKWRKGIWGDMTADLSDPPWDLEKLEPNNFFPMPASVIFATAGHGPEQLASICQLWTGVPGGEMTRQLVTIPATTSGGSSYGPKAHQGAILSPVCLFFLTAEPSTTSMVSGIRNVTPTRSSQENEPWKSLQLSELQNQPIEDRYIRTVHRGKTIAPFLLLDPSTTVLPWPIGGNPQWGKDHNKTESATQVFRDQLDPRMRHWWDKLEIFWDRYKGDSNQLTLIEQLDYYGKLTAQVGSRPVRLVYTTSGRPTAAVLADSNVVVDSTLYWIACSAMAEAHYLAAIINSDTLYRAIEPRMPKGQYGPRHLHKHLWQLQIPTYDPTNELHIKLAKAGRKAAQRVTRMWAKEQQQRNRAGHAIASGAARKHIRSWLGTNPIGMEIEELAAELVGDS